MNDLSFSKEQSKAINIIRGISALMIVSCHIFQGLNSELAWWFNVGVQIFLFMSGFLLAKNHLESPIIFIKKRLLKILVPYYILIVTVVAFYKIINIDISLKSILTYLFCLQGITYSNIIPGLEHLWFISIIMICYLLALFLNIFRSSFIEKYNNFFILIAMLILTQIIVNFSILPTAFGARIGAFILGYFIACKYKYIVNKNLITTYSLITILTLVIRIYFTCFYTINSLNISNLFNNYFINWQHTLLGSYIFILLYFILSKIDLSKLNKLHVLNFISTISYEIYLTHQIFILGPISLLFLTKYLSLNLLIIFNIILILSFTIFQLSILSKKILK